MHPAQERRTLEGKQSYRDARLGIPRLKSIHSCGVRDLSDKGAGLRLNHLPLLPTEFILPLDCYRTTLACRLVWRDGALYRGRISARGERPNLTSTRPARTISTNILSVEHVLSPFEEPDDDPARANRGGAKGGETNNHGTYRK